MDAAVVASGVREHGHENGYYKLEAESFEGNARLGVNCGGGLPWQPAVARAPSKKMPTN